MKTGPLARWGLMLLFGLGVPALADEPPDPPTAASAVEAEAEKWKSAWASLSARLNESEAVRMVGTLLRGGTMGPGQGWFGPSQSRYGWTWLAERFDQDGDDAVDRDEFEASPELFGRLDRNENGALEADDFDWSEQSAFARAANPAQQWFRRFDESSNGRVSMEEWTAQFERAAGEKGFLTAEDLRKLLSPGGRGRPGQPAAGPSQGLLLASLFKGELGSFCEGPDLDESAPDFTLPTHDGKSQIRLADSIGKRPVVMIFGSFT
jgi:hypothetical protein